MVFPRWRPLIHNKKGYLETGDRVDRSWKVSRDAGSRGPLQTANDGRKPDGKNNKDGGTGPIAVKKAVPTVAWPVGPILNNRMGGPAK